MPTQFQMSVIVLTEREAGLALGALDALALALTNAGHVWTAEERRLYEDGVRALKPKGETVQL